MACNNTGKKLLPITDNQHEYAYKVRDELLKEGIRVEV